MLFVINASSSVFAVLSRRSERRRKWNVGGNEQKTLNYRTDPWHSLARKKRLGDTYLNLFRKEKSNGEGVRKRVDIGYYGASDLEAGERI